MVVKRNNAISVEEIMALRPDGIVLSPGPGRPENAGVMSELIAAVAGKIPLFGVCLGHQAIAQYYGGKIVQAKQIMHGKISQVSHDGKGVFNAISSPVKAVRYHSLAVAEDGFPAELEISARSEDGEIMALRHKSLPIEAVQYHPESILSVGGKRQLANFLDLCAQFQRQGS